MDKKQAQEEIRKIFQNPFQRERYQHFLRNLLNEIEVRDRHYCGNLIPDAFHDHITQYWRVGKYIAPDSAELDLLIVEVSSMAKLDRARTALRNFAVSRLKKFGKECSLIAFYARDDAGTDWRFSFIKIDHEPFRDEKGKIKLRTVITPAKRYSYLVGAHENSHTAQTQLVDMLVMDYANPTIEEIEAAFSIEKVTEEFFERYKELYVNLAEQLKLQPHFQGGNAAINNQNVIRFAKKLLGQIVFLYFLQKKGWLGVKKDEKWGTGDPRFIQSLFENADTNGENFYSDYLRYLFYDALAKERRGTVDPAYYPRFRCKIPFLNGGLFEADYDWENTTLSIPNKMFRDGVGNFARGILDVFDRYNFTVKEDEPLEKEVAIDPEMLGKVFEKMLEVTERKGKGALHAPRDRSLHMSRKPDFLPRPGRKRLQSWSLCTGGFATRNVW